MVCVTVVPPPDLMMLRPFCALEFRSRWSHQPKVGAICFYQRGYYSSCLRDESCATRCLTSQVGVFLFVLFLFLLNYLLCSICLWVSGGSADGDVSQMSESFCWLYCWLYCTVVPGVRTLCNSARIRRLLRHEIANLTQVFSHCEECDTLLPAYKTVYKLSVG